MGAGNLEEVAESLLPYVIRSACFSYIVAARAFRAMRVVPSSIGTIGAIDDKAGVATADAAGVAIADAAGDAAELSGNSRSCAKQAGKMIFDST